MPKTQAPSKPVPNPTVQPAMRKASGKVPGSQSSVATARGKDARTAHDKDGNEAQRPAPGGARKR